MSMYKSCSRCGKVHDTKYKCHHNRVYSGGEDRRLRSQYAWAKKSEEIRKRSKYLCEVCKDKGIYTYTGLEVHHIEKLRKNKERFLDNYNLICLCTKHHKKADKGKYNDEYLFSLAKKREEEDTN